MKAEVLEDYLDALLRVAQARRAPHRFAASVALP
jgi:hypothetical protein